jgi:hypothetical protein
VDVLTLEYSSVLVLVLVKQPMKRVALWRLEVGVQVACDAEDNAAQRAVDRATLSGRG